MLSSLLAAPLISTVISGLLPENLEEKVMEANRSGDCCTIVQSGPGYCVYSCNGGNWILVDADCVACYRG